MTDTTVDQTADQTPVINPPMPADENTEVPTEDTADRSNAPTLDTFEKKVKEFGKAYGKGANSRPAMAIEATRAAQQIAGVSDKNAKDYYTWFQTAASRAKGLEYKAEASFAVQVSKLKQFLQLGALPQVDGVEVLDMACDIITEFANSDENPLKGSAYDNMVKVAREQLKTPDEPLSEEQVRAILTPDASEKTDLDKLIDTYKRVRKLNETIDLEDLLEAQTKMGDAIKALGGELPAEPEKKAKERQVAALVRRAKRDQAALSAITGRTVSIAEMARIIAEADAKAAGK